MKRSLHFGELKISATADKIRPMGKGYILTDSNVSLGLPFHAERYYRHGWQSWSLTAWIDPDRPVRPPNPPLVRPQADDPRYAEAPRWGGAWLGAVEAPEGDIILLGALGLEAHVELGDDTLHGWYETGAGEWFAAYGAEEAVFASYAALLAKRFGHGGAKTAQRVWCSWYGLYWNISETLLLDILHGLDGLPCDQAQGRPFDVFQVDDGWQKAIGDWEANEKFPSGMAALAARIRATGRTAGLWLAPLLVVPSARLHHEHPDWLLRDESGHPISAGYNWGEPLYALDTTHPAALDWLATLMKKVRAWGYDYLKLDFLYAGALPGKRYNGMGREAALRHGLKALREAMGEAYFLTCGTPILPALGLCDGMRIGPDVAGVWNNRMESTWLDNYSGLGTQNAIRTSLHRLWLRPLVHTDPDVAYFRTHKCKMTPAQKGLLRDLALITGFKASSDLPAWLTTEERQQLAEFLQAKPIIERTGRYTFRIDERSVDYASAVIMPKPVPAWFAAIWSTLANTPTILKVRDRLITAMAALDSKSKA